MVINVSILAHRCRRGRPPHQSHFEIVKDGRTVFHGDAGDQCVRVTGSRCAFGRPVAEPVPELWIFLAQVIHSGEATGNVLVGDVGLKGETPFSPIAGGTPALTSN